MASSSSNSTGTTQLTNSYLFYGTHPLQQVQTCSNFSNPTDYLTTTNDRNSNGYSQISTTKSLDNFLSTRYDEDDDNEIFQDAVESFDDEKLTKRQEESILDLFQTLIECDKINDLFFQNHLNESMEKTKTLQNRSLYHSLCHSTINFMQAMMTFNQTDIESTIQSLQQTTNMAKKFQPYKSWIPFSFSSKPLMNEYELHAKLVYAEALLIRALLTFIQDQSLLSFISGALKIKECHDIFVKLSKQNDPSRFSTNLSYEHFDSGVRMGNGAFNLMISNLPQRIIRCLEFAGFSGDRQLGLNELDKSAYRKGIRSPLSALLILGYHTFITPIFGNGDGDFQTCSLLVEHYLKRYPDSYLFVFFQARLETLYCRLTKAISIYQYAIQCQNDWKSLHHFAYWEILWCHVFQQQWNDASKMAKILFDENNWSKAIYCYLLSTFIFEENYQNSTQKVFQLYKRVPQLKMRLAGKSNPLEKYVIRKCEHFYSQKWLFLPALEFVYLLNGFYIIKHDENKLKLTLDFVNKAFDDLVLRHRNDQFYADSYGSGLLLRGVLYHFLRRYDEAQQSFDEIIQMSKQFDVKSFLPPNALLEKALVYLTLKQKQKAIEYLQKSLNDFKNYQLESRLQFRINTAMQTAKQSNED